MRSEFPTMAEACLRLAIGPPLHPSW